VVDDAANEERRPEPEPEVPEEPLDEAEERLGWSNPLRAVRRDPARAGVRVLPVREEA